MPEIAGSGLGEGWVRVGSPAEFTEFPIGQDVTVGSNGPCISTFFWGGAPKRFAPFALRRGRGYFYGLSVDAYFKPNLLASLSPIPAFKKKKR